MPSLHRFELVRKLATGGMADVFLALQYGDGGFQRDVVIKRLHPHLAEQEEPVKMFIDEAMLLARLSHPGFPEIYDYRLHPTGWYMALEWIRGPSIESMLQHGRDTNQSVPLEMSLAIVAQAAAAVHHAHELHTADERPLRVIHGDLTPANILIHRNGIVKIIDFGVAKTSENTQLSNRLQGTLRYMSPEQVRGVESIDHRTDIFALGVVLYEMTTSSRLFDGADVQVMTAIVNGDFERPSALIPDYPKGLEEIVLSCLELKPQDRPHDAAELTWAIHDLAQAHELPVDPNTLADRLGVLFPTEEDLRSSVLPEPMIPAVSDQSPTGEEAIQLHSWGDGDDQADFDDEPTESRNIDPSPES